MRDEQVLRELADGQDSALEVIVYRYHLPLFGYVYRMIMNEHAAEDVVQETFLRVFRQIKQGFIPDNFKPWLYKIATNLCKDYWKRSSTKHETIWKDDADPYITLSATADTIDLVERQIERQWMIQLLLRLPLPQRTAIYLRYYQDMTYPDMAEILELSVTTIKSQVFRGLQKLESMLVEDGVSLKRDRMGGNN